jgi:hypothetical protein
MLRSAHAWLARLVTGAVVVPIALIAQSRGGANELPVKYSGPPTVAQITPGDLMTRLYIFADDSMMGRAVGTEYNLKGTAYIEREVRRLGLVPAGDSGGYFQNLPLIARALDSSSTLTVGTVVFKAGTDFLASSAGRPRQYSGTQVVFGGTAVDTTNLLANDQVRGKIVLMRPFVPGPDFNFQLLRQTNGWRLYQQSLAGATVVTIGGEQLPPNAVRAAFSPSRVTMRRDDEAPLALTITARVAEAMLGMPLANATKGAPGKSVSSDVRFTDSPRPLGRNVVGIIPGTDAKLKGQYVAIGAHNDHIGFSTRPVDHDSLRAFMKIVRPQGADNAPVPATADQAARVRAMTDSLHKLHGARADSIYNGADDDGSGSVSVLEIAEAFARGSVKPRRSIIFVWHAGEEAGLWGSEWFTDHPTIPRDSIVAQLNMDMVGRGAASDVTGESKDGGPLHGGPGYLQLVGSRRLSTELGDLIEAVNKEQGLGFNFDYGMDANGHPQNIYCRSDHYEYARYGIPIAFLTTGGHADYHQVTDEPQYIDYNHMAEVARLVFQSALRIANLDHRVVVDKPKPDPKGQCVQ